MKASFPGLSLWKDVAIFFFFWSQEKKVDICLIPQLFPIVELNGIKSNGRNHK